RKIHFTYLPSSLMGRHSLGRLFFFFLPCVSIKKKGSIMFSATLLNCISQLKNDPVDKFRTSCVVKKARIVSKLFEVGLKKM
uniref:Uncharacterized protein n=1 Tax=Canis lupus dingo TaxID=286419 RepID=A0A8C0JNC6_CANLU